MKMTADKQDYVKDVWTMKRIKEEDRSSLRILKQNIAYIITKKESCIFHKKESNKPLLPCISLVCHIM